MTRSWLVWVLLPSFRSGLIDPQQIDLLNKGQLV